MDYYVKSIIPVIESNYDSFTTVEKIIADFFIHNDEKIELSAKAVSKRLFVSEASLSRFAKKCGYRGYREFVYQYEHNFKTETEKLTGSTKMVLNTYQELLNKTYNLENEVQVERICNYLSEANRVFVCGRGSSGYAAEEMELRFMRLGVNIYSVQDSDKMRMQAVFQDKKSVVIGLSISGESEDVLYFLCDSKKRGAKTILFTASNREVFSKFCDEVVLVPALKYLDHGRFISPQFPLLIMMDIIYTTYQQQDKRKKELLHDDTLRALGRKKNSKEG